MKTLIVAAILVSGTMEAAVTLTMDEVPLQPINGLAVTKGGITFTFTTSDNTMFYHAANGGALTFVQDPSIEGTNSAFGVAFSVPVSTIQFGFAASTGVPVATMATVSLFNNSATPFATVSLGSSVVDPFAEGQFAYNGSLGPVTNILITPATGAGFGAIGFDNLSVNPVGSTGTPVPAATPLTLALTAICLAGLTMFLLRQQPA